MGLLLNLRGSSIHSSRTVCVSIVPFWPVPPDPLIHGNLNLCPVPSEIIFSPCSLGISCHLPCEMFQLDSIWWSIPFLVPSSLPGKSDLPQQHRQQHVFTCLLFSSCLGEARELQIRGTAPVACWQAHEADSPVTLNANNEIYYLHCSKGN